MSRGKRWRGVFIFVGMALSAGLIWALDRLWSRRFIKSESEDVGIKDQDNWLFLGRQVLVQSVLACKPEQAWEQAHTSGLLMHVSWPILTFKTGKGEMPAIWDEGEAAEISLFALGVIPMGKHTIHMERVEPEKFELQTRESGQIAQVWNHRILIEPYGEDQALYTDDVQIYAGKLTPVVTFFARFFYRYRQTRWQKLAKTL